VATWLIISIVLSTLGAAYFVYGWREKEGIFLLAGAALSIFPFVVSNPCALIGIGVVLLVLPFVFRYWAYR
jgi:hypothetical protein